MSDDEKKPLSNRRNFSCKAVGTAPAGSRVSTMSYIRWNIFIPQERGVR